MGTSGWTIIHAWKIIIMAKGSLGDVGREW